MVILKAEACDLNKILILRKTCFEEVAKRYNDYSIPVLSDHIEDIEKEHNDTLILKAQDGDRIVGSVKAYEEKNICYIGRLVVHPDYRNKGIGTKLMLDVEKRYDHCSEMELFTGSRDEKNIYLYKKLGYKLFEKPDNDDETLVYLKKIL